MHQDITTQDQDDLAAIWRRAEQQRSHELVSLLGSFINGKRAVVRNALSGTALTRMADAAQTNQ